MLKISILLLSICFARLGSAQTNADMAPGARPSEGGVLGGRAVAVETNVPLEELIQRLEGDWSLVETGKGYWIGYTRDMYSIASHGEQAIEPLMRFIRTTSSDHARQGALLSLHLIGIEGHIAGRFHEEFKSKSVRKAFYGLLEDPRLGEQVLSLLVRDPWPSDVPHIMKALRQEDGTNCRPAANALFRYRLPCPTFGGTLAQNATNARVLMVEGTRTSEIGQLYVFTEEQPNEGVERINYLNSSDSDIVMQWQSYGGRKVWKFKDIAAVRRNFAGYYQGQDIRHVTYDALLDHHDFVFRYCDLSDPFNFQVAGTDVFILDPSATRMRWLGWWEKQPDDYKDTLERADAHGSAHSTQ